MIYLSKTDFFNFKDVISQNPNVTCRNFTLLKNFCFSTEPCSSLYNQLSPLTIKLSDYNYVIPPQGYLLDSYGGHTCAIAVSYVLDSYNMYILGDPFIRSFYTTFDYGNNKIMLAVNVNAPEGTMILNG